jgi:hypothetical protein
MKSRVPAGRKRADGQSVIELTKELIGGHLGVTKIRHFRFEVDES